MSKVFIAIYFFLIIFLSINYIFILKKLKKNIFKIIFILVLVNKKIFSKIKLFFNLS